MTRGIKRVGRGLTGRGREILHSNDLYMWTRTYCQEMHSNASPKHTSVFSSCSTWRLSRLCLLHCFYTIRRLKSTGTIKISSSSHSHSVCCWVKSRLGFLIWYEHISESRKWLPLQHVVYSVRLQKSSQHSAQKYVQVTLTCDMYSTPAKREKFFWASLGLSHKTHLCVQWFKTISLK